MNGARLKFPSMSTQCYKQFLEEKSHLQGLPQVRSNEFTKLSLPPELGSLDRREADFFKLAININKIQRCRKYLNQFFNISSIDITISNFFKNDQIFRSSNRVEFLTNFLTLRSFYNI